MTEIDWERLRTLQIMHEIRMDRNVQLPLLTDERIAATLTERVSLDGAAAVAKSFHSTDRRGESQPPYEARR